MLLSPDTTGSGSTKRKPRWGRRLLIVALLLLVAVGVLIALAPSIASSIAPGKVESALNAQYKGTFKVGALRVGWFSPTAIGPIQVLDPAGAPVAKVEVNTTTTLWRIVSERWWSMKNLDLGTIDLAGDASIVRGPDGKSNLERALEPRVTTTKSDSPKPTTGSGGGGGGIESIKGDLRITNFDLAYAETDASGKKVQDLGLRALKGNTKFDYQTASGGSVAANVDLQGAPTGAAATDPLKVKLDADIRQLSGSGAAWPLPDVKALKANISNVPLALVDGILKMNGSLVRDIGPRADLFVGAAVSRQNVAAKLALVSDGAKANLDIATKDGAIVAMDSTDANLPSNTITLRSTEFLDSLPGLRDQIANVAKQVRLDRAPSVTVNIENLRWPLPDPAKSDLAATDLRGNGLTARIRVSEMAGRVALDQSAPAATANAPASTANWKPFTVAPLDLTINAADLAKPVTITGGTKATLDGAAAGDIALSATAAGLLDAQGHLRALSKTPNAGLADDLDAQVRVTGLSTALIQPIVAASGLALDTSADIGPTLDLALNAKADVKGVAPTANAAPGASAIPPVDFTARITSNNIKVDGAGRMAQGVVSTTGNGLTVNIAQSAGLAQRIMTKPGQPAALELSGIGAVALTVKDFSAPLDKLKGTDALAAVKALISAEVSNLGVKPVFPVADATTTNAQPVQITKATLTATLDGANPPKAALNAALNHENQPFDLTGTIALNGITGGKLPPSAAGTAQLIAFKPSGKVELKNAPRSLANLVPAAAMVSTTPLTGDDMPTQIARAIRESIGRTITATLTTQPDGSTQKIVSSISTEAGGLSAETATTISVDRVVIDTLTLGAGMKPEVVNPVLAAASKPAASNTTSTPAQLAQPFRITAKSSGPITVPLKPGTFEPAWAAASDAAIAIAADNAIIINNVPTGTDESGRTRTNDVTVQALKSDIKAPLSGLDPAHKSKRLAANFSASAVRSQRGGSDFNTIADISGTLAAAMDGTNPDADIKLAQIDCAVVEGLIGKPGLLTGALGDTAEAHARIAPKANAADTKEITASITAPRLTEAKLNLEQNADRIALSAPSVITWKPDPVFVSNFVLGADAAAAAGKPALRVSQAAPVTIRLTQFAMATSRTDPATGQPTVGPLKPGVFMLDAAIDAPSIALAIPTSAPAPSKPNAAGGLGGLLRNNNNPNGAPAAPQVTTVTLETITIAAKQELNAPELTANIGIARVKGEGASGDRPSTIKARVANLADSRGVIQSNKAVVNLDADVAAFPTAIVDTLANQGGLMTELLGPTINMQATARNISLAEAQGGAGNNAAGSIDVKAGSPRATATLKGDLKNGAFMQTGPINVSILEIRPDLINLLSGSVPVITSLEKNPGDQPGIMDGTTLQIPINGDLKKLNGDLTIDPGVARFQTESIFGELISALGGKTGGTIGQKLQPFVVHMREGVLTYDKFDLPVGQFTISTRGTVDLVNRQVNVVTYAPLGSLTDKALGKLSTGIPGKLGVLDQMTQIPISTKGPMGATKTELDLGLFMKETGDRILKSPENLINTIGDLIGGNKNKPPAGGTPAPAPAPAQEPAPDPAPKPKPPPKKKKP